MKALAWSERRDCSILRWNSSSKSMADQGRIARQLSEANQRFNSCQGTHFFDYEIRPSIGEAGTYFYHSHVLFQAVSVAGPLIVEEASGSPPYEYDEEKMFFVSEFFNKTDEPIVEGLTAPTFKW